MFPHSTVRDPFPDSYASTGALSQNTVWYVIQQLSIFEGQGQRNSLPRVEKSRRLIAAIFFSTTHALPCRLSAVKGVMSCSTSCICSVETNKNFTAITSGRFLNLFLLGYKKWQTRSLHTIYGAGTSKARTNSCGKPPGGGHGKTPKQHHLK